MRMGAIAISTLLATVAFTGSVRADDPFANFNGFYAGVLYTGLLPTEHATYGASKGGYDYSFAPTGWGYGAVVGYGMNFGGYDGEVSADFTSGHAASGTVQNGDATDTPTVDYVGHVRGIVGYPMAGIRPFVSGGVAAAQVSEAHSDGDSSYSGTNWVVGGTIGAGVDIKTAEHFSLRLEVLEDFFPTTRFQWTPSTYTDARYDMTLVRAGINYRF